jgi:hypothetical protein
MNNAIDDVFGNTFMNVLDNLTKIFTTVATTLDVVKIVMEQKGFKGTGLKASVNLANKKVALMF